MPNIKFNLFKLLFNYLNISYLIYLTNGYYINRFKSDPTDNEIVEEMIRCPHGVYFAQLYSNIMSKY